MRDRKVIYVDARAMPFGGGGIVLDEAALDALPPIGAPEPVGLRVTRSAAFAPPAADPEPPAPTPAPVAPTPQARSSPRARASARPTTPPAPPAPTPPARARPWWASADLTTPDNAARLGRF